LRAGERVVPKMEEQAAQGHEDASRIAAIDRLGLHIIDDAVVVPVPDEEIVPQDLESVDTYSGEDKQNPVITVDGSVIKSVNCYGREVSTSAIKWMVCALLIVIAIVVPTALTLSNQNEAVSRRPQPGLTDKEINELARHQRLGHPDSSLIKRRLGKPQFTSKQGVSMATRTDAYIHGSR
jgi:hypothetical protein